MELANLDEITEAQRRLALRRVAGPLTVAGPAPVAPTSGDVDERRTRRLLPVVAFPGLEVTSNDGVRRGGCGRRRGSRRLQHADGCWSGPDAGQRPRGPIGA